MNSKASLHVPKFKTNVVIEFEGDLSRFKVEYIPNSCYTEKELNEEVRIIIKEMLKTINNEMK